MHPRSLGYEVHLKSRKIDGKDFVGACAKTVDVLTNNLVELQVTFKAYKF